MSPEHEEAPLVRKPGGLEEEMMADATTTDSSMAHPRAARNRPPNITPDNVAAAKRLILDAVAEGMTLTAAGHAAKTALGIPQGISVPQIVRWRQRDPAFGAAFDAAWEAGQGPRSAEGRDRRQRVMLAVLAERGVTPVAERGVTPVAERKPLPKPPTPSRPKGTSAHRWEAWEDRLIRREAGLLRSDEILALLNAERLDYPDVPLRTPDSLASRAVELDVSLEPSRRLTQADLARLFGANRGAIKRLVRPHIPHTSSRPPGVYGADVSFFAADVERFIREHPWLYTPASLGTGRLADLARTLRRSDPWLTLEEIGRYLGLTVDRVRRDVVPHLDTRRRRLGCRGNTIVARRRDVVAYACGQLSEGA